MHAILFLAAAPISAFAIGAGFRRHGLFLPAATAAVALALIGVGAFGDLSVLLETGATVLGSLLLAVAHVANLRAADRMSWQTPATRLS